MSINTKRPVIFILALIFLLFFGYFLVYKVHVKIQARNALLAKRKTAWNGLVQSVASRIRAFPGSAGVVIQDLDNGWEFSAKRNEVFPSASLAKIPIMVSYLGASAEGKIDLDDRITVKVSERTPGSGVLKNNCTDVNLTIADLMKLMITESDNTAANVLIDHFGVDALNRYFKKMGLRYTNLSRKMMDFKMRSNGIENYTTAGEMADIVAGIYHNKFFNKNVSKKALEILKEQKMRDRIPRKLPKNVLVAHKTGLEKQICHDVGIVYTPRGNYLISVLVKHNEKTALPAKNFIADLAALTYEYYQSL